MKKGLHLTASNQGERERDGGSLWLVMATFSCHRPAQTPWGLITHRVLVGLVFPDEKVYKKSRSDFLRGKRWFVLACGRGRTFTARRLTLSTRRLTRRRENKTNGTQQTVR